MKRVVIWGVGKLYNQYRNTLKYWESMGIIRIAGLIDKKLTCSGTLDGWKVIERAFIAYEEYDNIIVLSENYFMDIRNDAIECGVSSKMILSYKVFNQLPEDFELYCNLYMNPPTIISNNCWGGILYSTLGLECISPFKNLFLNDEDYLKLLNNLPVYLNRPLQFERWETDIHSKLRYPVMRLGDVCVHFNHDTEVESASEKWTRRLNKINWNNVIVEMYTENCQSARKFSQIDLYENKILFVPFETDIEIACKLEMEEGQSEFYETVNRSASEMGFYFNLVKLLTGEIEYRYIRNNSCLDIGEA